MSTKEKVIAERKSDKFWREKIYQLRNLKIFLNDYLKIFLQLFIYDVINFGKIH